MGLGVELGAEVGVSVGVGEGVFVGTGVRLGDGFGSGACDRVGTGVAGGALASAATVYPEVGVAKGAVGPISGEAQAATASSETRSTSERCRIQSSFPLLLAARVMIPGPESQLFRMVQWLVDT